MQRRDDDAREPATSIFGAAGDDTTGPFSVSEEFAGPGHQGVRGPALLVLAGGLAGAFYPLDQDRVTLGRAPSAGIFLGDVSVSREHAELTVAAGEVRLRDLESLNGTYVNRRRIEEEEILQHGDELQIGKFRLGFIAR